MLEDAIQLVRLAGVDDVAEHERPAGPQQVRNTAKCDRLPDIRKMVQRVPRVHGVRSLTVVLVGEEACLDALDPGLALTRRREHHR